MDEKTGDRAPTVERPRTPWARLALVVLLSAVIGALTVANWNIRPFSLIIATVEIRAGIVILVSVAMGFLLGRVFILAAFGGRK